MRRYKKNQNVFYEGDSPNFYYQIVEGSVKMISVNESGKEFIQGIFEAGQSFGEPVLLIDKPYPATAVVNEDSTLIKISKEEFLKILIELPKIHYQFTKILSARIYDKALLAKAISINGPEHRVLSIFKILKDARGNNNGADFKVELSRQQIADMIGYRVEIVIRTIKRLEKKGKIKICKGKVYL